jgi:hypothetical protein
MGAISLDFYEDELCETENLVQSYAYMVFAVEKSSTVTAELSPTPWLN